MKIKTVFLIILIILFPFLMNYLIKDQNILRYVFGIYGFFLISVLVIKGAKDDCYSINTYEKEEIKTNEK